jgi:hypothetical protein
MLLLSACYSFTNSFNSETVRFNGTGEVETLEYDFSDFDSIDASHVFEVDIEYADVYSVVVRVDEEVIEYLDVSLIGSKLNLGLQSGFNYNIRNVVMEAEVRLPRLTGISLSGASYANVWGFESNEGLRIYLSGSSELYGDIISGDARFDLSGASEVELYGSCAYLKIDASGSSRVYLEEFYADSVDVFASGASNVYVWTNGRLNVDASGGSDVLYEDGADLGSINTSGGASVDER